VIGGLAEKHVKRITLSNLHLEFDYTSTVILPESSEDDLEGSRPPGTTDILKIPENETKYPDIRMFGDPLPTWGIFIRHATAIRFSNVHCYLQTDDPRPANLLIDIKEIDLNGVYFHNP
jgi:hypothetical protein